MINFCGAVPTAQVKPSGKTHCRQDELAAHRNTITIANEMMLEAANAKDYEAVSKWSEMIDFAQEKVFKIIEQEDVRSSQKCTQAKEITDSALNVTDKALQAGVKLKLIA